MPFREQPVVALCGECKEPASGGCRRCHMPLCNEHDQGRRRRCESCEQFHDENVPTALSIPREVARKGAGAAAMLPATALVWAAALGWAAGGARVAGVWGAIVGFAGGFIGTSALVKRLYNWALGPERVLARAKKRWRKKFLRERKPRLLTARKAQPD